MVHIDITAEKNGHKALYISREINKKMFNFKELNIRECLLILSQLKS